MANLAEQFTQLMEKQAEAHQALLEQQAAQFEQLLALASGKDAGEETQPTADDKPALVYDGRCNGIKPDGNRCKRSVAESKLFCGSHAGQAKGLPQPKADDKPKASRKGKSIQPRFEKAFAKGKAFDFNQDVGGKNLSIKVFTRMLREAGWKLEYKPNTVVNGLTTRNVVMTPPKGEKLGKWQGTFSRTRWNKDAGEANVGQKVCKPMK